MTTDERIPVCAIGILPNTPYVYWDYDFTGNQNEPLSIVLFRMIASYRGDHWHYWTLRTKHGVLFAMQTPTWDKAQEILYELHKLTAKVSIMNCRKQRMRISPKWDLKTGMISSPAPVVVDTCGHVEYKDFIKGGKLEFYTTFEHTKDTREWRPEELTLPSKGEKIQ